MKYKRLIIRNQSVKTKQVIPGVRCDVTTRSKTIQFEPHVEFKFLLRLQTCVPVPDYLEPLSLTTSELGGRGANTNEGSLLVLVTNGHLAVTKSSGHLQFSERKHYLNTNHSRTERISVFYKLHKPLRLGLTPPLHIKCPHPSMSFSRVVSAEAGYLT